MIRTTPTAPSLPSRSPRGFTLVEMMVAVALVVVMMLMFATVFQTAGGLVSRQKGMAELDQSTRTMITLLRGDIKQRTFIDVVPYVGGQNVTAARPYDATAGNGFAADFRRGYFSISENDPQNSTDDSLHLTITTQSLAKEPDERHDSLPFSGKATLLRALGPGGFNNSDLDTKAKRDAYLLANPDQPEFDDGQIEENSTGSSEFAEVSWFLRNGNLYRRQLLIRRPYNRGFDSGSPDDPEGLARDNMGNTYLQQFIPGEGYGPASYAPNPQNPQNNAKGVFWHDFDYSAFANRRTFAPDPMDPMTTVTHRELKFHVTHDPGDPQAQDSLDNTSPDALAGLGGFPRSLGIPILRFGNSYSRWRREHLDPMDNTSPIITRMFGPKEYGGGDYDVVNSPNTTPPNYIGRFTVQETSHSRFHYPGNYQNGDPFNRTDLTVSNGLVNQYSNENDRRGEDLVLTNVHEFDIEVWDDLLNQFVDLGHNQSNSSGTFGLYHFRRLQAANTDFGNRYDTWHPSDMMPASPPYAPFDDTVDGPRTAPDWGLGKRGEIPLKAIRIKIRYYDSLSQQMRDLTFTFTLNRENASK